MCLSSLHNHNKVVWNLNLNHWALISQTWQPSCIGKMMEDLEKNVKKGCSIKNTPPSVSCRVSRTTPRPWQTLGITLAVRELTGSLSETQTLKPSAFHHCPKMTKHTCHFIPCGRQVVAFSRQCHEMSRLTRFHSGHVTSYTAGLVSGKFQTCFQWTGRILKTLNRVVWPSLRCST